jgi:glucan 1,3-beta-glucosidase
MFSKLALSIGAANAAAIVGTNIGGWMVLEPWISPSLFYQFLNKSHQDGVGMDSYTLCEALGPVAGNSVMRAHWETFYTEDHIKDLAAKGVKMVRLPIGDWTLNPYGPYVGCMDGAEDKIQWMFDICAKYGIQILLDVHAVKDSQNGFDNSGKTNKLTWNENGKNFTHWPNNQADWLGPWGNNGMSHINYSNIQWSLEVCEKLLQRWGSHSAFGAFEPVNEPWWNTDMDLLKEFYRAVRKLTQRYAPQAYFVFHDSFRYDANQWNDLFRDNDIDKVAIDHHYYQAFNRPAFTTVDDACKDYE